MGALKKVTFYNNITLDFAHLEAVSSNPSQIFTNNYRPIANNNTRSLVCFEGTNNSVGVSDDALGYTFSVYRRDGNNKNLIPIYSKSLGKLSVVDYNVRNQKEYQYYIFKEDAESISKALLSNTITTCWWDYAIIGMTLEDEETKTYKVDPSEYYQSKNILKYISNLKQLLFNSQIDENMSPIETEATKHNVQILK